MGLLERLVANPPPLRTDEGGAIRIGGTRVTLDTVVGAFKSGAGADEIVDRYLTLNVDDVHSVIAYYRWNRDAVEEYLEQRRREAEELRQKIEAIFPKEGLRERLLARRAAAGE